MELITIEISKELFQILVDSGALVDFKIKLVNVPDYDYSSNEIWKKQKEKADKVYKELKQIEFEIRNK